MLIIVEITSATIEIMSVKIGTIIGSNVENKLTRASYKLENISLSGSIIGWIAVMIC